MHLSRYLRDTAQWAVYCGFCILLPAAAFLAGGVVPSEWQWIAAGVGIASLVCVSVPDERPDIRGSSFDLRLLVLLALWMMVQLAPLPASFVKLASGLRWSDLQTAYSSVGRPAASWIQLSVAPSETLARLLKVLPAMAAFVAARQMGCWWNARRLWMVTVPVIVAAGLEALIGVAVYSPGVNVTGTYVNRNHFAGLLEMAFPLAVMWAAEVYRRSGRHRELPIASAVKIAILLGIAALLLFAIAISLSRGGFLSTIAASALISAAWLLLPGHGQREARNLKWKWLIAIGVPACLFLAFATGPLLERFAALPTGGEFGTSGRVQLSRETLHLIGAYKWTGCGLGAYEHCFYPFRASIPTLNVDFAHDDYLQAFAELGLVGGFLLVALGIWIGRRIFSVVADYNSRNWSLAVGVFGTFVAMGLHSFVDFNMYIPANALAFAWVMGVAASPAFKAPPGKIFRAPEVLYA